MYNPDQDQQRRSSFRPRNPSSFHPQQSQHLHQQSHDPNSSSSSINSFYNPSQFQHSNLASHNDPLNVQHLPRSSRSSFDSSISSSQFESDNSSSAFYSGGSYHTTQEPQYGQQQHYSSALSGNSVQGAPPTSSAFPPNHGQDYQRQTDSSGFAMNLGMPTAAQSHYQQTGRQQGRTDNFRSTGGFQPLPLQQQQQQQRQQYSFGNYAQPQRGAGGGMQSQQMNYSQASSMLQPQAVPQPASAPSFMISGMQQLGAGGGQAALGAQILTSTVQSIVPDYAKQMFTQSTTHQPLDNSQFMRVPKYYFMVDNRYVLRKLAILFAPFMQKKWKRLQTMHNAPDHSSSFTNDTAYLPPREDINAPDLYIPVMAFVSYVLLVGFISGTRGNFKAENLKSTSLLGLLMLLIEVFAIKAGLVLIQAAPTKWLDLVAFRGYKFVGVNLAMALGLIWGPLYMPVLYWNAFAMGVFLMRSHRRIVLPQGDRGDHPEDLKKRNAFLFAIFLLQFGIYTVLAVKPG